MNRGDYTNYQDYSLREVPPPEINYSGSSPPHRYCIYLDFDNIYGGCLDYLGIKAKEPISPLQGVMFSQVLECFLSKIPSLLPRGECAFIKAFAEYENLPHSKAFKPGIQIFLHNIGIKPISPFVSSGKRKNKNASDIALTLEVVNDLIIKGIPVDSVIICSGDIDFYPLISWIREHTNKNIYIMSFSKRTSRVYNKVFDFSDSERLIWLDDLLTSCFKNILEERVGNLKGYSSDKGLEWFKEKVWNLIPEKYDSIKDIGQGKPDKPIKTDGECEKFKKKVLEGLKSWLRKNEYASTGLIITNWLPRWNLDLDEEEANKCLKELIESGDLEKEGFIFEGEVQDRKPMGRIRRL